ncbi:hypothetical protein K1719_020755 [Acacia pycnantha]|nr:hypothetical protein K1719_020755 [Acacia pycnantha]
MTERNLKGFQRSRNFNNNNNNAGRGSFSNGNSSRKRKVPWDNSSGGNKRPVQTEQQNYPRLAESQSCPKCKKYHPGVNCDGKRICYRCQKTGHITWNCPEKAAETRLQNSGRIFALTNMEAGESSGMDRDTIN